MRTSPAVRAFCAIGLMNAAAVFPTAARAEHRLVPSQYSTIQAAIDACNPGDFVDVSPGVYSGVGNINLDFHGVDLSCRGLGGPAVTIIDAAGSGSGRRGLMLTSGETRAAGFDGFTIRNAHGSAGGGIYCSNASPTIRNCWIQNCDALWGGGIALRDSGALVQAVTIENCVVNWINFDQGGGGLSLENSNARFEDCIIRGNRVEPEWLPGGGVWAQGGGSFARCVISGNVGSGATVTLALLDHCTLAGNTGAEVSVTGIADLTGCILSDPCAQSTLSVSGWATANCCMVQGGLWTGGGTLQWLSPPIVEAAAFCEAPPCTRPTTQGSFALLPSSPGRPENNDCGEWIGAITAPDCSTVGVGDPPAAANLGLRLVGANPTRGSVDLSFRLPVASAASISVLDVTGRRLARLGEFSAGPGEVTWHGSLRGGSVHLAPGIYLIEVHAAGLTMSRQVVLLP
ncbi:MAG: right-handed parallel beta-helix repeat-containing protein [Candidatus Eisenbacteria bacterium]